MTEYFLPYGRQTITNDDQKAVIDALSGEIITRGEPVEQFERAIAEYCGAEHAVAFTNGTAALQASYWALEISCHDRIVASPNSFVASIIGLQGGAQVEFPDIDRSTGGITLKTAEPFLNRAKTRGRTFLVPVHFAGIACDMQEIEQEICDPEMVIIEDAAHAIGSSYPSGEKVGSCAYSDLTIFSFHPVKTITTGEGGMVTTNDAKLAERLRLFRNNGMVHHPEEGPWCYRVETLTGNFNMTSFQAALGLSQLKRLDDIAAKRRALVKKYREKLKGVRLFDEKHDDRTCYHLFVTQMDFKKRGREAFMNQLHDKGVGSQVHYIPLYRQPVVSKGEQWIERCPEMEAYYKRALSLPLYPEMTPEDVERVAEAMSF